MDAPAADTAQLYRAAVGEAKAEFYVPRFLDFDAPGASKASWNWAAFFGGVIWLLYRRMYGLAAIYYFAIPIALTIVVAIVGSFAGKNSGAILQLVVWIAISFVLLPMYANAIYHDTIKKRIAKLSAHAPSPEALVQRVIGQASTSGGAVVVILAVIAIPVIGILAAIAIPAYQDYVIRAQVTEGLMLAAPVKAGVAEVFAKHETWPAEIAELGIDGERLRGKYVESVRLDEDGTVLIHYGNAAHMKIAGQTLDLRPLPTQGGGMEWSCGYAAADGTTQTTIEQKYLPRLCRG